MAIIATTRRKSSTPNGPWWFGIHPHVIALSVRFKHGVDRWMTMIAKWLGGLLALTFLTLWSPALSPVCAAARNEASLPSHHHQGISREYVGIYQASGPGWPQSIASALASRLQAAGMKPVVLSIHQLTNPGRLRARRWKAVG